MKLNMKKAELYIPDGYQEKAALARTTHLSVGAHQDDLEIMSYAGIIACFQQGDSWFTGVVVTNGSGSARTGVYEKYTDEAMIDIRGAEQKKAAMIGGYAAQFLLDYPSAAVKDPEDARVVDDLEAILKATRPTVCYCHNLADKHDTHIGTALKLIEAIRRLPETDRPEKLYGCEVWRDLDWMADEDKVAFDTSPHENLQAALLGVFDSQVAGGKRYDLATLGRRRAHATYHASHDVDETTGTNFAMDLSPLIRQDDLDPLTLVQDHLQRFAADVENRLKRLRG